MDGIDWMDWMDGMDGMDWMDWMDWYYRACELTTRQVREPTSCSGAEQAPAAAVRSGSAGARVSQLLSESTSCSGHH
jgi:hypothetical protein